MARLDLLQPYSQLGSSRGRVLRKRLVEKCPDVRMVQSGRGRFSVEVTCRLSLEER